MTLLETVKALPFQRKNEGRLAELGTEAELIDVAVAWLKGEVAYMQIVKATGSKGSNVYNFLAVYLKKAYEQGQLGEVRT